MFIGQQPPSSNPWTTLCFYPSTSRTIGNKYTKQNHWKVCSVIKSTIYIRSRKSYIFPLYLFFSFFPLGSGWACVFKQERFHQSVCSLEMQIMALLTNSWTCSAVQFHCLSDPTVYQRSISDISRLKKNIVQLYLNRYIS